MAETSDLGLQGVWQGPARTTRHANCRGQSSLTQCTRSIRESNTSTSTPIPYVLLDVSIRRYKTSKHIMEFRTLARPAARLLSPRPSGLPIIPCRGHKTTSRTKRSLKIAPHESFLPDRKAAFPAADSIIYNPPSSEASPLHTPFLFLPPNDARRVALTKLRHTPGSPLEPLSSSKLPPQMKYNRRSPNYNLTAADIKEMKQLRQEDPETWTVNKLAEKFGCSVIFVKMAAPAPENHLENVKRKLERRESRWGAIRTNAREERKRRTEMLYRGEL